MRNLVLSLSGLALFMGGQFAHAQQTDDEGAASRYGAYPEQAVHDALKSWSESELLEIPASLADERMFLASFGRMSGEARAARYSLINRETLSATEGGLTFECADLPSDPLSSGLYTSLSDEEIAENCDWVLWEHVIDNARPAFEADFLPSLNAREVEAFLDDIGGLPEDSYYREVIDWSPVVDLRDLSDDAMVSREYTLAECPSLGSVLSWLEGFEPTPADIVRFGEDKKHPAAESLDTYYRATIFSNVNGGSLDFNYNGYSGEPEDVAVFFTAAMQQCALETAAAND